MDIPYHVAFFQGEDFTINVKINHLSTYNHVKHGFIELIWIKHENQDWTINLSDQTIKSHHSYNHKKFSVCLSDYHPFDTESKTQHTKYTIKIPLATIHASSLKRELTVDFSDKFYKKYKNFYDCYGALISERKLVYLAHLHEQVDSSRYCFF